MKNIYLVILFIILINCSQTYPQTNPRNNGVNSSYSGRYDSLLYDGADEVISRSEDCNWVVKKVTGEVIGPKSKKVKAMFCGQPFYFMENYRDKLKEGDVVHFWDSLTMKDDNSMIQLEYPNGTITFKCREFIVPSCKTAVMEDKLMDQWPIGIGKYFFYFKKHGAESWYIKSQNCVVKDMGTKYSIKAEENEDIIEVFEGTVEVKGDLVSLAKTASDLEQETGQLNLDMANKKITVEEWKAKMDVLSPKYKKALIDLIKTVILNAGYRCSVDSKGVISDPVPIESTGTEWFDDVNFK